MTTPIPPTVIGLKTLTLVLGGLITFFAAKAAVRTGATGLRYLAVGFATVTMGSLVAGVADQLLGIPPAWAMVIENALAALGFALIAYSLAVRGRG